MNFSNSPDLPSAVLLVQLPVDHYRGHDLGLAWHKMIRSAPSDEVTVISVMLNRNAEAVEMNGDLQRVCIREKPYWYDGYTLSHVLTVHTATCTVWMMWSPPSPLCSLQYATDL